MTSEAKLIKCGWCLNKQRGRGVTVVYNQNYITNVTIVELINRGRVTDVEKKINGGGEWNLTKERGTFIRYHRVLWSDPIHGA